MSVKFLAQGNNDLPLTGFETIRLAIIRLLVRRVNNTDMPLGLIEHIHEQFWKMQAAVHAPYRLKQYSTFKYLMVKL
jgi:hypothetical protein